jgi:putative Holliday junction resolvase
VLGIDLGEARIGIALSDGLGMLAHPRETVRIDRAKAGSEKAAVARIKTIAREEDVRLIILGLPRNMDGTEGSAAAKARAFADRLKLETECEVRLLDERLTTVAAQKCLHAAGRNVKQGRAVIDQVAAQLILQTYLDGEAWKAAAPAALESDDQ